MDALAWGSTNAKGNRLDQNSPAKKMAEKREHRYQQLIKKLQELTKDNRLCTADCCKGPLKL